MTRSNTTNVRLYVEDGDAQKVVDMSVKTSGKERSGTGVTSSQSECKAAAADARHCSVFTYLYTVLPDATCAQLWHLPFLVKGRRISCHHCKSSLDCESEAVPET